MQALVAGVAASAQEQGSQVVKDAYAGLKTLITHRFAGKPAAEVALAQHAEKPDVGEAPLREALSETGASDDPEIVQAAQRVMELSQDSDPGVRTYNNEFAAPVYGLIQGDHAKLDMRLGGPPEQT